MKERVQSELSIEALRAGDAEEFARLVEKYSPLLYRLAMKMLGNVQDAEDVLQNTFLKTLQHLDEFEERSSLSTWLYRIAVNEALMLLRHQKPETPISDLLDEDEDDEIEMPQQFVDWCCLPEEELLSAEGRRILEQAIQRLPPKLRAVFLLRDIEGLSIQETSKALNLSEAAVKTRLLRARLNLREQLSSFYAERVRTAKGN